jgi:hypothetical protein
MYFTFLFRSEIKLKCHLYFSTNITIIKILWEVIAIWDEKIRVYILGCAFYYFSSLSTAPLFSFLFFSSPLWLTGPYILGYTKSNGSRTKNKCRNKFVKFWFQNVSIIIPWLIIHNYIRWIHFSNVLLIIFFIQECVRLVVT